MDKVLIDTDVILDFFFDRTPFSIQAAKIFSLCEQGKIKAFVTPVIISNVYYILRQTAKHEKVIEKLSQLLNLMDVILMDKSTIVKALNSSFKDFEDALQNYAAVNKGDIQLIITRNTKDFKASEIAVLSPNDYLKTKLI